jgi:S-adenosylmethionine synthetase
LVSKLQELPINKLSLGLIIVSSAQAWASKELEELLPNKDSELSSEINKLSMGALIVFPSQGRVSKELDGMLTNDTIFFLIVTSSLDLDES